jgi:hypothetical protein
LRGYNDDVSRFVDIPEARIHGGPMWRARARAVWRWRHESGAGRVITWSATLGAAQAGLLLAAAGTHGAIAPAFAVLTLVFSLAAALVVATAWLLRLAVPLSPRLLGAAVPILFYGAASVASPQAHALLALTLLAPAAAWATWLPRGRFEIKKS